MVGEILAIINYILVIRLLGGRDRISVILKLGTGRGNSSLQVIEKSYDMECLGLDERPLGQSRAPSSLLRLKKEAGHDVGDQRHFWVCWKSPTSGCHPPRAMLPQTNPSNRAALHTWCICCSLK